MSKLADLCACGQPLHYTNAATETYIKAMIRKLGECVQVRMLDGDDVYLVPRHYIALHGIKGRTLPAVAEQYGFKKVKGA